MTSVSGRACERTPPNSSEVGQAIEVQHPQLNTSTNKVPS
ncbi:hypothetical protein, variant [Coccidioides immitis RS]|uniref:Uncharacterized protein n=2 Tax=Coccidioides immitis TaxID=5501 RepID=A0A0D8JW46_COCIM|nr:hypothetical protein, variant [Coccidioides immitis RS]KJF61550.1 hypothetical protein, variant [Coccidioides immitis RS]KMU85152.1 hypothetical protein CIHG_02934 [Coccidioides immitis H538.4]